MHDNYTYIFTHFDEYGAPFSNNVAGSKIIFNMDALHRQSNLCHIDSISDHINSYAFIINLDFIKLVNNHSVDLHRYLSHEYKIPPKIISLIRSSRCVLMFYAAPESFDTENSLLSMYFACDYLSIRRSQFLLVSGSSNIQNINSALCDKHKITGPINVIGSLMFLPIVSELSVNLSDIPYKLRVPLVKKFVCLNRAMRRHRSIAFLLLRRDRSLMDFTYYSMNKDGPYNVGFELRNNERGTGYIGERNFLDITHEEFNDALAALPYKLDNNGAPTIDSPNADIYFYYQSSLFNIVTETLFYEGETLSVPRQFLTEKSFKPFMVGQIPIMIGGLKTVEKLRSLGFDVFDDIVNHNYDYEFNNDLRMKLVVDEICRINKTYSLDDCTRLAESLHSRFLQNINTLQQYIKFENLGNVFLH